MSTRLPTVCVLVASLLVSGATASRLTAQVVEPLIGLDDSGTARVVGTLVVSAPDGTSPSLPDWWPATVVRWLLARTATHMPEKETTPDDPPMISTMPQTPEGLTCPYLTRPVPPSGVASCGTLPSSVLENLTALAEAQQLFERAEREHRIGHTATACVCYDLIQQRYPGSRYALLAREGLVAARQHAHGSSTADVPNSSCPYVKAQTAAKPAPLTTVGQLDDVLGNIEKLEKAGRAYRKALGLDRRGRWDQAQAAYEETRRLCPGSRYDCLASTKLEELQARRAKSTTDAVGEEQEAVPSPRAPKKNKRVPRQTSDLLENCRRALAAGQTSQARELARQALTQDPVGVAAHPLVYKMHLLDQVDRQAHGNRAAGTSSPLRLVIHETHGGEEASESGARSETQAWWSQVLDAVGTYLDADLSSGQYRLQAPGLRIELKPNGDGRSRLEIELSFKQN